MRIIQVTALVAVAGLFSLLVWRLTHQSHPPKVGKQVPAFALKNLNSDAVVSTNSLRGKPTVINFFASWCPPCKSEAPLLESAFHRYKGRVNFVAIDVNDVTSDARRFVTKHDLTFPALRGEGFTVADKYGVAALPETFVVDARGHVLAHIAGTLTVSENKSTFFAGIQEALKP
jgi:cytochrome c biogenesis protein CcmG, thiol:disulfide interchange protein DsbE